MIIKSVTWVLLLLMLLGCSHELTQSYLMQHPKVLQQAVADCEAMEGKSQAQLKQCDAVLYAAASFTSLLNDQQADPKRFGQRVMDAETAYVRACEAKDTKASIERGEEVATLLAVVGVSSSP